MSQSVNDPNLAVSEETWRRAYEPYVGEHDEWEEEPGALFRFAPAEAGAEDEDFEGLETNRDEGLFWREIPVPFQLSHVVNSVLVVEDEAILGDSLREWLTESGYRAEIAREGEEALKAMEQRDFDLMLLDLRLPGKDGLEVLREARLKKPGVKGIIITAYPEVKSAVEAMKLGAVDFLTKPLDLDNLEKLVAQHVRADKTGVAAASP